MNITHQDLKKYTDEIFTEMCNIFNPDKINIIKNNFDENYKDTTPEAMSQCIEKFTQAELDYVTLGNRGIGRLTETIPRLGSYFRNYFSKLDEIKQEELDTLITKLITKGYIFVPMFYGKPKEQTMSFTSDELYQEWIPKIYTFNLDVISDDAGKLLLAVTEKDINDIKNFFNQHNMKGGGLFSKDKTDDILNHYLIAGVSLYFIEKLKTS